MVEGVRTERTWDRGGDGRALVLGAVVSVAIVVAVFSFLGRAPAPGVPAPVARLPALNAMLNAVSAVLLAWGYVFIRRREVRRHLACMASAFVVSTLFLASYVTYHAVAGSRPFTGGGWLRAVYFPLLISHVVLAAAIVPLALVTLYRAARADFARHRGIARWTLPLWLYVAVTGVIVYLMLYRL
ncbi:MAG TPA: DUF420 domain-containing protein [Methylomirabilota bacterium]|jgi:uncharacterized membrane protein YozB (DUF420 family)